MGSSGVGQITKPMVCSHKPLPGMGVDFTQDGPDIQAMIY